MKVLVVLPPAPDPGDDLVRRLDWIRRSHPGATIGLSTPGPAAARYSADLSQPVSQYDGTAGLAAAEALVLVQGMGTPELGPWPSAAFSGRIYVQEQTGRLVLKNQPFDRTDLPDFDTHAFSRLAPRDQPGYYYFPYGYGVQWPGMGRVDSFGFRGQTDWDMLSRRDTSHRLVVVCGGSAAWSQGCFPEEAFPALLESQINQWCEQEGRSLRVSVVNLSLFGNLVINQIINYVLFAARVRPDYVIAHDGFNDLLFGQVSDSWLLSERAIAYLSEFEWWSQRLHQSADDALTHRTEPFAVLNLPHVVVRAYVERKTQFKQIVEASGARFIWGFQPCIFSKAGMSPHEAKAVKKGHPQYDTALRGMAFLYETFMERARIPSDVRPVDCHRAFGAYGASDHLFYDYAHATPAGDEKVAGLYFEQLRARLESDAEV